jgi:hypothetical protein
MAALWVDNRYLSISLENYLLKLVIDVFGILWSGEVSIGAMTLGLLSQPRPRAVTASYP